MKTGKYQKTWDYKCKRSTRIFGVETKVGVHLIPDGVQTHEVPPHVEQKRVTRCQNHSKKLGPMILKWANNIKPKLV